MNEHFWNDVESRWKPRPTAEMPKLVKGHDTQAPTQPLDGATAIISFYVVDVSVGSPMSGWLQTFVNKSATA